jgi:hypothetical protein
MRKNEQSKPRSVDAETLRQMIGRINGQKSQPAQAKPGENLSEPKKETENENEKRI